MSKKLKFSLLNALFGLFAGLFVNLISGGNDNWNITVNAPISAFICAFFFWGYIHKKKNLNRNEKLIVIGFSTGTISHALCWILIIVENIFSNWINESHINSFDDTSFIEFFLLLLTFTGISLIFFGWITITCSIVIGYWIDRDNKHKGNYLFTSERLGFRKWSLDDLDAFYLLNSDEEVMEYFPKTLTKEETKAFIIRLQKHYDDFGHTYYATEIKETGEFIGFIGLAYQDFESEFTPNVDIGWRLKKTAWGKGFATEGAKKCLDIAFNQLHLTKVISTCTLANKSSEKVMQKIGMQKISEFKHPKLEEYPEMQPCLLYEITR